MNNFKQWLEAEENGSEIPTSQIPNVQARKALNRLGVQTLGDLAQLSLEDLMNSDEGRSFTPEVLSAIRSYLWQAGLTLRDAHWSRYGWPHSN